MEVLSSPALSSFPARHPTTFVFYLPFARHCLRAVVFEAYHIHVHATDCIFLTVFPSTISCFLLLPIVVQFEQMCHLVLVSSRNKISSKYIHLLKIALPQANGTERRGKQMSVLAHRRLPVCCICKSTRQAIMVCVWNGMC
jgi:hypothetical protein